MRLILLALVASSIFNTYAQTEDIIEINQLDSLNCKDGICLDDFGFLSYSNGIAKGPAAIIDQTPEGVRLRYLYFFDNDELSGPVIFFHGTGGVSKLFTNLMPNTNSFTAHLLYSKVVEIPYQSYCYCYDENGRMIGEGWCLLGEEFTAEYERVGTWKFYKSNGTVDIIDFSDPHENRYSRWK